MAARCRGGTAAAHEVRAWPLGGTYDVLLFSHGGASDVRYATASIQIDEAPPSTPDESTEYALAGGERRLLSFKADDTALQGLASASRITLTIGSRRIALAPTGMPRAVQVLASCQRLLQKQLGIDPTRIDAGHEPAPRGHAASWFSTTDYPSSALAGGAQGVSRLLLTISPAGHVDTCVTFGSSGNAAMDQAACRAFQQRGRYLPATDSKGEPITGWVQQSVRWRI